jgi:hypothetical protein
MAGSIALQAAPAFSLCGVPGIFILLAGAVLVAQALARWG